MNIFCVGGHVKPNRCKNNEFSCSDNGNCIDLKFKCDGYQDCNDNSDEICPPGKLSSLKSFTMVDISSQKVKS